MDYLHTFPAINARNTQNAPGMKEFYIRTRRHVNMIFRSLQVIDPFPHNVFPADGIGISLCREAKHPGIRTKLQFIPDVFQAVFKHDGGESPKGCRSGFPGDDVGIFLKIT